MKKVACLGGSFDPIHQGHLAVAQYVLKECEMDEVWFIPTQDNPLKERVSTEFHHRQRMIELMIQGERNMFCCTIEKDLPTPSYTIHTVRELTRKYPDIKFSWIIGDDLSEQLSQWKSIDELLELIQFIVVSRDQEIKKVDPRVIYKNNMPVEASSTQIRQGDFRTLSSEVRSYIYHQGLYLRDILSYHCGEKRKNHTLTMTDLAVEIAQCHSLEKWKVVLTAMMHDIFKEKSEEEMRQFIDSENFCFIQNQPYLWHSYAAEGWLKEKMLLTDEEILNAVRCHTNGKDDSPLGLVIYLADKLDRGRGGKVFGMDSEVIIELAKEDLRKAFNFLQEVIVQWKEKEEN